MKRFWMVWAERGGRPTYKHETRSSAETEAARLARAHGGVFHVLECVGTCERPPLEVKWTFAQSVLSNPPVDETPINGELVDELSNYQEGIYSRPRRSYSNPRGR